MSIRFSTWGMALVASIGAPSALARQEASALLSRCHYRSAPDTVRALPAMLREISGLASYRGMLLAHDDEMGRVYSINPASGAVAVFATLQGPIRDDFEGIAVLRDTIWLMTSAGRLYGLRARTSDAPVPFVLRQTTLAKRCELEGLAADDAAGILLLPCKIVPKNSAGLVIMRWNLASGGLATPATIEVSGGDLKRAGVPRLRPTAVEVTPGGAGVVVLSSSPPALVELDAAGVVRGYARLGPRHAQAEGLAITPRGDIYVSDEGSKGLGTLSLYRCRPK